MKMKQVVIDNARQLVMVNGKEIPRILLRLMRGAVGKSFVVKRYRGGRMVVTHFPQLSGIVPTEKQKVRRNLFREAVVFAKWIIADEERKLAFKNTLPRKKRKKVYQAALQLYMKMRGNKQWVSKQLAVMAVVESGKREFLNGIDVYEQNEQWRVMWRKRKGTLDVLEQEVDEGCLVELRI
jgi:hypothetical protein